MASESTDNRHKRKRNTSLLRDKGRLEALEAMYDLERKAVELSSENAADRALSALEADSKRSVEKAPEISLSELTESIAPAKEPVDDRIWQLLKERFAPDAEPEDEEDELPGEAEVIVSLEEEETTTIGDGIENGEDGETSLLAGTEEAESPDAEENPWDLADTFDGTEESSPLSDEGEPSPESQDSDDADEFPEETEGAISDDQGDGESIAEADEPDDTETLKDDGLADDIPEEGPEYDEVPDGDEKDPGSSEQSSWRSLPLVEQPEDSGAFLRESLLAEMEDVDDDVLREAELAQGAGTEAAGLEEPEPTLDDVLPRIEENEGDLMASRSSDPEKPEEESETVETEEEGIAPIPFEAASPVFGDGEQIPIILPDVAPENLDEEGHPVFLVSPVDGEPGGELESREADGGQWNADPFSEDGAVSGTTQDEGGAVAYAAEDEGAPDGRKTRKSGKRHLKIAACLAGSLALALGGYGAYSFFNQPNIVQPDNSPSIISAISGANSGLPSFETLQPGLENIGEKTSDDAAYPGAGHGIPEEEAVNGGFSSAVKAFALNQRTANDSKVTFSRLAGSYAEDFKLEMIAPPEWTIHYTLDGSTPTVSSPVYKEPIEITDADAAPLRAASNANIDACNLPEFFEAFYPKAEDVAKGTVVKAYAVSSENQATPVTTATYFTGKSVNERYGGVAVVSLTTEEKNLFDYNTGIMSAGVSYDNWKKSDPYASTALSNNEFWTADANFKKSGREWEREAYIEVFDGDDTLEFASPCGIRIKGDRSRYYSQKSFNIYFRKDYGDKKEAGYDFFDSVKTQYGDEPETVDSYKSISLRNGGNDTEYTKFRDSYLQSLLTGLDFGTQAQRPAVLFINGEYWGVYCLSEKWSKSMISSVYGVDGDEVVSYKGDLLDEGVESDDKLYKQLMSYQVKDLSDSENWNSFKEIVDIQSMADHYAAQTYIANEDFWPNRNSQIWRTRTGDGNGEYSDGRWRWLMYDTEYSSGIYPAVQLDDRLSVENDTLKVMLSNHPLFRSAMANSEFRSLYRDSLQRIADTYMEPSRVVSRLAAFEAAYRPLMADYYARFGGDVKLFDENVKALKDFVQHRAAYLLPAVDADLSDFDSLVSRVKRQTADNAGAFGEADASAAEAAATARLEQQAEAGIDIGAIDRSEMDSRAADAVIAAVEEIDESSEAVVEAADEAENSDNEFEEDEYDDYDDEEY